MSAWYKTEKNQNQIKSSKALFYSSILISERIHIKTAIRIKPKLHGMLCRLVYLCLSIKKKYIDIKNNWALNRLSLFLTETLVTVFMYKNIFTTVRLISLSSSRVRKCKYFLCNYLPEKYYGDSRSKCIVSGYYCSWHRRW